jgi:peptidoglycan/LPS O-acetylase OafA/YrhL
VLFPLQVIGLKLVDRGVNRWLLWSAFVILGLILSLIASTLSYELIEVRMRRFLNSFRDMFFRSPAEVSNPV